METSSLNCVVLILVFGASTMRQLEASSCGKAIFWSIEAKRGDGRILTEQNGISFSQCLRACRLTSTCYRFNFGVGDVENGQCQLLTEYVGLRDDKKWSYYVACPDGMDYYESTGSCYGLAAGRSGFDDMVKACAAWAPGVHVVDIYNEPENDVCGVYRNQTGDGIFIGARRPEGNSRSNGFRWITTGQTVSYSKWNKAMPQNDTNKQCVTMNIDGNNFVWMNTPCSSSYFALCEI